MRMVLFVVLLVCACDKAPMGSSPTNNAAIRVDLLFEHEGCRVYRFEDGGRDVKRDGLRQFLRIVSSGVHGREDYFTVNPLMGA